MAVKSRDWDKTYKEKGEVQKEVLPKVRDAAKLFKRKKFRRILDLACGTGRHAIYLATEGFSVYATDISRKGIEITKEKAKRLGLKNIKCKVHDMNEIPFSGGFFDGVLCVWSMGHGTLATQERIIDEMRRVLKPNGILLTDFVSTKDETYCSGREIEKNTFVGGVEGEEDVPHHYFTRQEIKRLFARFSEVKIRRTPFVFLDGKRRRHTIEAFSVEARK